MCVWGGDASLKGAILDWTEAGTGRPAKCGGHKGRWKVHLDHAWHQGGGSISVCWAGLTDPEMVQNTGVSRRPRQSLEHPAVAVCLKSEDLTIVVVNTIYLNPQQGQLEAKVTNAVTLDPAFQPPPPGLAG